MNLIYAVLFLHSAGKEINEANLKSLITAIGGQVDEAQVKALVTALQGINIDETIKRASSLQFAASPSVTQPQAAEKKEEREEEEAEKRAEEAAAGLSALFG